jgi:ubiquinone/menaquinone biosynthesis C-methylase UbiE
MLSRQQAKKYYDKFGKKQDWQGFYEDIATNALVRNGELDSAVRVFEFGCGTGRFGQKLLENHLPSNARYVGIDISDTMIGLAKDRLARFGDRAEVHQVDGSPKIDFEAESFDRFVSTYVLDLLSIEDIQAVLQEAWRILTPGGLIGLTSLTHKSRLVMVEAMRGFMGRPLVALRPGQSRRDWPGYPGERGREDRTSKSWVIKQELGNQRTVEYICKSK